MKRDYAAEYAARIQQGLSKGQSRAVARGHGPFKARAYDSQLEAVVKEVRAGKSLAQSSKSVGVSSERAAAYMRSQGIGKKVGSRWRVGKDSRTRELPLFTNGEAKTVTVRGYKAARRVGQFMSGVGRFLETGDPAYLAPFVGESVKDASGRIHPYETDPNALYQLSSGGSDDFSLIYRINN